MATACKRWEQEFQTPFFRQEMGSRIGGGSGRLGSIEGPGRCSGRSSGGQAEMGEDLGDHGGMFDGGDDLQGVAALGAVFPIDLEHSFTKALPGFRPAGRRSPFKTRSRRFCDSRAQQLFRSATSRILSSSFMPLSRSTPPLTSTAYGKGRRRRGFNEFISRIARPDPILTRFVQRPSSRGRRSKRSSEAPLSRRRCNSMLGARRLNPWLLLDSGLHSVTSRPHIVLSHSFGLVPKKSVGLALSLGGGTRLTDSRYSPAAVAK